VGGNADCNEIIINTVTGWTGSEDAGHHTRVVERASAPTLTGKYMSLTLLRLFLNVPMVSDFTGELRKFTLLEALWENVWDYRVNTIWDGCEKMIDSSGFQHPREWANEHEYSKVQVPGRARPIVRRFQRPEEELEAHARTKGWLWYGALPDGVVPHRFNFQVKVFEPGKTSGWVQDRESYEFVLCDHTQVPASDTPEWKMLGRGST